MRIVIAGGGGVGRYLAAQLTRRDHDVVLVERSDEAIAKIPPQLELTVVQGDACAPTVLDRAALREADVVVAVTGDDEDNLVISLLAKEEYAVPRVLARVNDPANEWLFDPTWGVDVAISPPHLLTALVEEEVLTGDLISLLKLQRGEIELLEVRLAPDSAAVDHRVEQLRLPPDAALVAVVRQGRVLPARATMPLIEGDEVLALVGSDQIEALRAALIGE